MAEFAEVVKQRLRMCNAIEDCDDCPLRNKRCSGFNNIDLEDFEKIVMQWAAEHPVKTNADKFEEVFGFRHKTDTMRACDGIPCIYESCKSCKYDGFWNKEYKEREEK